MDHKSFRRLQRGYALDAGSVNQSEEPFRCQVRGLHVEGYQPSLGSDSSPYYSLAGHLRSVCSHYLAKSAR